MKKRNVTLSVCVPAFNEENSIEGAVEDLVLNLTPKIKYIEVIIVDDGSRDLTLEKAKLLALRHKRIKIIVHCSNRGIGRCYQEALRAATGDYFTWFPADHENSARELVNCLPHLSKECIVTSHHRSCDCRSKFRCFLSRLYTWILNKIFGMNLKYFNGLTIIPTNILRQKDIYSKGFAVSAESIIHAVRSGCRVVELEIFLKGRTSGRSKALSILSLWRMVIDVIRLVIEENRNSKKDENN